MTAKHKVVNIEEINVLDGLNVRVENKSFYKRLEDLTNSILENGYLPSKGLAVYEENGKFFIIDGHTRFRAVNLANKKGANIKTLPVTIVEKPSDVELNLALFLYNLGQKTSVYENGLIFKRLLSMGMTMMDMSRHTGFDRTYLYRVVNVLMDSPDEIHEWVKNEQYPALKAIRMIETHKEKAVAKIEEEIYGKKEPAEFVAKKAAWEKFNKSKAAAMSEILIFINRNEEALEKIKELDARIYEILVEIANESYRLGVDVLEARQGVE